MQVRRIIDAKSRNCSTPSLSNQVNPLKKSLNTIILMTLLTLLFAGCYYDVEEELYPVTGTCDTTSVSYTASIAPIMNQHCVSCHSGSSPSGNIDLSSYASVKNYAADGSLYGSVSHASGWSAMPQNAGKIDACSILKIQVWINKGTPN